MKGPVTLTWDQLSVAGDPSGDVPPPVMIFPSTRWCPAYTLTPSTETGRPLADPTGTFLAWPNVIDRALELLTDGADAVIITRLAVGEKDAICVVLP